MIHVKRDREDELTIDGLAVDYGGRELIGVGRQTPERFVLDNIGELGQQIFCTGAPITGHTP